MKVGHIAPSSGGEPGGGEEDLLSCGGGEKVNHGYGWENLAGDAGGYHRGSVYSSAKVSKGVFHSNHQLYT